MLNIFYVSAAAFVIGLATAYYYAGWHGVLFTVILSVLEITLSFENAIVNAVVLKDMSQKWRERFLTWGIIIAVFGMRMLFPITLVACLTDLNIFDVLNLALDHPKEYARYLHDSHSSISAFGGMFLLMVFLGFLLDHNRKIHWLGVIERKIAQIGNIEAIEMVIALLILLAIQNLAPPNKANSILLSGIAGLVTYVIIHSVADYMNNYYKSSHVGRHVRGAGLMSFLYLEVLDASFSFDGVIGAFAITKDIIIIMLGLGIGAFFVRSLTIFLVQKNTLQKYIFLEHGAYYALGMLSIMMLFGIYCHIPEILIGSVGIVVISLAFISSLKRR